MKQGIHSMTVEDYINDPAPQPSLNASIAHVLLTETPLHAKRAHPRLTPQHDREESSRLDLGTIAHALLLENDRSRVVVIEADDWRKKEAKQERDIARARGKLPILMADFEAVEEMVSAARQAILESEVADDFAAAIPEQTLLWKEEGIWMRSRPDKATDDWRVVFDYKTCAGTANPLMWSKAVLRHGYDLQCALALRGIQHLFKVQRTTFVFLVQEVEPPYALALISLDPAWLKMAEEKLRMAMSIWKGCLRTNEWPGYPSRIAYLEPPTYAKSTGSNCGRISRQSP